MPEDTPLKSAYDLAMERLRAKDRKSGIPERAPLTKSQKQRITKLRQEARAKVAEIEIMFKKKLLAEQGDPEKVKELEEHFEIDRRRVESTLEAAITKIREEQS